MFDIINFLEIADDQISQGFLRLKQLLVCIRLRFEDSNLLNMGFNLEGQRSDCGGSEGDFDSELLVVFQHDGSFLSGGCSHIRTC